MGVLWPFSATFFGTFSGSPVQRQRSVNDDIHRILTSFDNHAVDSPQVFASESLGYLSHFVELK